MEGPKVKQTENAIPTSARFFDLVNGVDTSEMMAWESWTLPSLSPPTRRDKRYCENVVDVTQRSVDAMLPSMVKMRMRFRPYLSETAIA